MRVTANYAAAPKEKTVKTVERTVYLGKLMIRISGPRAEIYETNTTTNRLICVVEFIELWRTMSSLFLLVQDEKGKKHGHV